MCKFRLSWLRGWLGRLYSWNHYHKWHRSTSRGRIDSPSSKSCRLMGWSRREYRRRMNHCKYVVCTGCTGRLRAGCNCFFGFRMSALSFAVYHCCCNWIVTQPASWLFVPTSIQSSWFRRSIEVCSHTCCLPAVIPEKLNSYFWRMSHRNWKPQQYLNLSDTQAPPEWYQNTPQ